MFRTISRMFTPPSSGGGRLPPDNSLELERMRQEEAARARAEQQRIQAEQLAARRSAFQSNLDNAMNAARSRAQRMLQSRGLDPAQFDDIITNAVSEQRGFVPDLAENVNSYFNPDFVESIFANEQNNRRQRFTNEVNRIFTPNFERDIFADTADDGIIEDILGRSRSDAASMVERARARGNLDDTGFASAMRRLDDQAAAGRATAQQLGGNVLQGFRESVRGIGDRARTAAGSYSLGSGFDPNTFQRELEDRRTDLTNQLDGAVRGALVGQQFFDVGDIIQTGGNTQGAVNPRTDLTSVLARRRQLRDTQRGVGSEGTF